VINRRLFRGERGEHLGKGFEGLDHGSGSLLKPIWPNHAAGSSTYIGPTITISHQIEEGDGRKCRKWVDVAIWR
jgi:hypothetical protein